MSHINNGNCPGCLARFNKYPGFYRPLQDWFFSKQAQNPTFHVAEAGRNKIDQEIYFARKASLAHWPQSSHNFGLAIDTFFQISGKYCLDRNLFDIVMENLDPSLSWYGATNAEFFELPHIEIRNWKELVVNGQCNPIA